jgi:hypothetical protein
MYLNNLNTDHSTKVVGPDVEKYGKEAFEMIIIERIPNHTPELLTKRERFYIKMFAKVGEVYNVQFNSKWDEKEVKYGRREAI